MVSLLGDLMNPHSILKTAQLHLMDKEDSFLYKSLLPLENMDLFGIFLDKNVAVKLNKLEFSLKIPVVSNPF